MTARVLARRGRKTGLACQHRGESGFSMLEAIVAIGILGICLLPILNLQISVNSGTQRLERITDTLEAQRLAEQYIRGLAPALLPAGQATIGQTELAWKTLQSSVPRPALSEQSAPGRFEVRLVSIQYTLSREGAILYRGLLDRLTWRETASFFDQ